MAVGADHNKLSKFKDVIQLETVKESWKIWYFHFDLQLVPTVLNGTFLYYQETTIITQKAQNC